MESHKKEMKHQKPENDSLHLVNNVKITYDVKKAYDLLINKNYDQVKINLEQVMENLVLSNDTTGKSSNIILTEVFNQIQAFGIDQL